VASTCRLDNFPDRRPNYYPFSKSHPEVFMFAGLSSVVRSVMRLSLVSQIAIGIAAGVLLVIISPKAAGSFALLGQLFVSALKAVAPVLVFLQAPRTRCPTPPAVTTPARAAPLKSNCRFNKR
jgi:hypothetical protein